MPQVRGQRRRAPPEAISQAETLYIVWHFLSSTPHGQRAAAVLEQDAEAELQSVQLPDGRRPQSLQTILNDYHRLKQAMHLQVAPSAWSPQERAQRVGAVEGDPTTLLSTMEQLQSLLRDYTAWRSGDNDAGGASSSTGQLQLQHQLAYSL